MVQHQPVNPRAFVSSGPQTPRTPRTPHSGNAEINEMIYELCEELGLEIAPRDILYSPSQQTDTPGTLVRNRIQFLFYKDRLALGGIIESYKTEIANHLDCLSPQERTNLFLERLKEPTWIAQNRIIESPRRSTQSFTTTPNTHSWLRMSQCSMPGYNASLQDDNMPPTPSKRRPTRDDSVVSATSSSRSESRDGRGLTSSKTTTAYTSFATSVSDLADENKQCKTMAPTQECEFGSSFTSQEFRSAVEATNPDQGSMKHVEGDGGPSFKRRRSGDKAAVNLPHQKPEPCVDDKRRKQCWHHQIRALSQSNLGAEYDYVYDDHVGYVISVERARLLREFSLTRKQADAIQDHQGARSMLSTHELRSNLLSHPSIWDLSAPDHPTVVMNGKIVLNQKSDNAPLFQLSLQPTRREFKSSRIERRFGCDRVLMLKVPSLTDNLPAHLTGQKEALASAFIDWITKPLNIFGRAWCAFHVDDIVKKIEKKRILDACETWKLTLFALDGDGITEPLSHFGFLNWMIDFRENGSQPVCKAHARIDLNVSRTLQTISFKPTQVRPVDDIQANGESENESFEDRDPMFRERPRKVLDPSEVMTDGCARISVGAALLIRETLGIDECPAVFQARINGHKGIWHVSAAYDTLDCDHRDVWIELRHSQRKIVPRAEDLDPSQCEKDRWSFDVNEWSRTPKPSVLYKDFIPILKDRHVPRDTLAGMAADTTTSYIEEWQDAMSDPAKLALLRHQRFGWSESRQKNGNPGLPKKHDARVQILMDEAGYMPTECAALAESLERLQEMDLQRERRLCEFPCLKSTMVFGIADPHGVLEPGKVHLSLSRPLTDERTKKSFVMFAGTDVLVARHPAIRGSDIQKVSCVCHPQLAHLKDVIVMPSRGQIPLAAKLQGGDYDGDKFWVCADERLVVPFLNAPLLEPCGMDFFDIRQEKRKLKDVVPDELFGTNEHVEAWLKIVLPFAFRPQTLGIITNYCNELQYSRNNFQDAGFLLAVDLHDLIIDAAKNGYLFDQADFAAFLRKHRNTCPERSRLRERAYLKNLKAVKFERDPQSESKQQTLRSALGQAQERGRRSKHILDDLLFNIINPLFLEHLEHFRKTYVIPAQEISKEPDLEYILTLIDPNLIDAELKQLNEQLETAFDKWKLVFHSCKNRDKLLGECIELYNCIQPTATDNPVWRYRHGPTAPTTWDCFKVAILARDHYGKKKKFMVTVAHEVVCYLKSQSESGKRVVDRIRSIKKPKKPTDWDQFDAEYTLPEDPADSDFDLDYDEEVFDALDL